MFIQVIQGQVSDAGELHEALERWNAELAPGALGWLGSTSGVTGDGTSIAVVRFASAAAAQQNSERPEQHQWWMETSKLFTSEVSFHDCEQVRQLGAGGSDDAGFVQIIQGRIRNPERMEELMERAGPLLADARPDLIGSTIGLHGDGGFTQAAYFSSEDAARRGERRELTGEVKALFEEEMSLMQDLRYFDLREPWLHSPR